MHLQLIRNYGAKCATYAISVLDVRKHKMNEANIFILFYGCNGDVVLCVGVIDYNLQLRNRIKNSVK